MSNKFKAVIYCRLSREDGNISTESNSITNQKQLCEEYIDKSLDIELAYPPFVDDGVSGVLSERPAFDEMLELVKKGNVNCIVVKDLSRFSRDYIDAGRLIEKVFPSLNVRFIAINDSYDSMDTNNKMNSFVLPFKNLINDRYCNDISVKIRTSLDIKRKNGENVAPVVSYGYLKSDEYRNQIIVDEQVADNIRLIFREYINGRSIQEIANILNDKGIFTPLDYKKTLGLKYTTAFKVQDNSKWEYNTVRRILTNEIYKGTLVQGKRGTVNHKVKTVINKSKEEWIVVEDSHEAIIDTKEFDIVNQMLCRDVRSLANRELNLLSGVLFCSDCGATMVRKTVKVKGEQYRYYVCSNNKKNKKCSPHSIQEDNVKSVLLSSIKSQVDKFIDIEELLNSWTVEEHSMNKFVYDYNKQIDSVSIELTKNNNMKLRLYEDFKEGIITQEEYREFKKGYNQRIAKNEEVISLLRRELEAINLEKEQDFIKLFTKNKNITKLDRRLLVTLVDEIRVFNKNSIEIVFRYQDMYERLLSILETKVKMQSAG